jgi:hypothetical protein
MKTEEDNLRHFFKKFFKEKKGVDYSYSDKLKKHMYIAKDRCTGLVISNDHLKKTLLDNFDVEIQNDMITRKTPIINDEIGFNPLFIKNATSLKGDFVVKLDFINDGLLMVTYLNKKTKKDYLHVYIASRII